MSVKPDEVVDLERRGVLNNGVFKLDLSPQAMLHAEKVRQEELKKDTAPVLAALPDGTAIVATRWVVEREKERIGTELAIERTLKTGENIASGPGGAIGYGIAGDRGSDVGALFDTMALGWSPHPLNTQEVVNAPRDYRPYVQGAPTHERQPAPESRAPEIEPPMAARERRGPEPPVKDVGRKAPPETERVERAAAAGEPRPGENTSTAAMQRGTLNRLAGATPKPSIQPTEEQRPGPLEGSLTAKQESPPAREPRRIKISPVLPPKEMKQKSKKGADAKQAKAPAAEAAEVAELKRAAATAQPAAAGGGTRDAQPAAAKQPKKSKTGASKSKAEKIPSPQKLEKEVQKAVERDARSLPPSDYVTFGDENFGSMIEQLRQLKQVYDKTKGAPVLNALERKDAQGNTVVDRMVKMSAPELMDWLAENGRPELKTKFEALREYAKDRPLAQDEIKEFLSSGPLGTRRPDTVMLRLRAAQGTPLLSITDTTRKETPESFVVHEFKTFFYGEAFSAVLDLKPEMAESFEHNPKLGIHRPALSGGPLSRRKK
jgi:hypothetical protein